MGAKASTKGRNSEVLTANGAVAMGVLPSLQVLPRPSVPGATGECVVIQAHPGKAPSPGLLALPWALLSLRLHHISLIPCQGFRVLMAEW